MKLDTSSRTCAWIVPFQETVYSARRHLQKADRGTKDTSSEIWWSWVLPVCLQQETLTQLEFCDEQQHRQLWQHLPFLSVALLSHWDQKTSNLFVLPPSLHDNKFDPCQWWSVTCKFLTQGRAQTDGMASTRSREKLKDTQQCKPPCRAPPWPWMLAYNSVLTSSWGHPVGPVTMIPETCPPCHKRNFETASFKYRAIVFSRLSRNWDSWALKSVFS